MWLVCKRYSKEKAGILLMEKGTGVLWQERYIPKRYSSRRARMEDKMEGNNICRVWEVQVTKAPKYKRTRDRGLSLENS